MDQNQIHQEWPLPMAVDASLPKPWFVAAYHGAALGNVLRSDYGAIYRDGEFHVDGGTMLRVSNFSELHGRNGGTLFVLFDPLPLLHLGLSAICNVASDRGIQVVTLRDRRRITSVTPEHKCQ